MSIISSAKSAFLNMKIRKKTIFLFLVAGVLPFLLYVLYSNYYANQQILEREKSMTASSLQQAVMSVENKLETYDNLSNYLYNNRSIVTALNTEYNKRYFQMYLTYRDIFKPIYSTYYSLYPELKQILIYSDCDLHPNSYVQKLDGLSSMPWFPLVEGRRAPTWIVWENEGVRQLFSVRLIGDSSRYHSTNYLYFMVDYESLFSPFRFISEDAYDVFITDADGSLIFSTSSISKEEMETLASAEGQNEYMLLTDTISTTKWNVYFYKPHAQVQAYVRSITNILYFVGFLLLLLFGIMVYLISLSVVTPIESLTATIKEVYNGNSGQFTFNIDSSRQDEVGTLYRNFSRMMERIRYYIDVNLNLQSKILYAQINPHFLYNALSLINSKAIMADQEEISQMALLLSSFYRTALNQGKDMTTLENELLNIRSYIQLQLLSYSETISVVYNIDDSVTQTAFPNFILQPLVENALDHGLKNCCRKDKTLQITAERNDSCLAITIRDNGIGMNENTAAMLFQVQSSGYGIKNVNERLRLIYGEDYSLVIQSSLGEGTMAVLRIPL